MTVSSPLRVALVHDHPLVVEGLAVMLRPYADRVEVVELMASGNSTAEVDVVLCDAAALVAALERVAARDPVPQEHLGGADEAGTWPGRDSGLAPREAEIVTLIGSGMSNNQIAERLYLSINSVKSYIRSAYRTMGVSSRSQAVLWALDHGMRARPKQATTHTS